MNEKILIVEDQFIEANDLRNILEAASYHILGIARSVDQALELLKHNRPDIVLIDILLTGTCTGIDLAIILEKDNIPFIFLSANSNQSTLEEAKATQPYGFVVKPFRDKDILTTLEIALYRYYYQKDAHIRQQTYLSEVLDGIVNKVTNAQEQLLLIAKAFQPFINFDQMLIDTNLTSKNYIPLFGYQRLNYDEYQMFDIDSDTDGFPLFKDLMKVKSSILKNDSVTFYNGQGFLKRCEENKLSKYMYENREVKSEMIIGTHSDKIHSGALFFFSTQANYFNREHAEILRSLIGNLISLLKNINYLNAQRDKKTGKSVIATRSGSEPSSLTQIAGRSPLLLQALDQAIQVAPYDTSVLILGETGSGKEGIVNVIHEHSPRKDQPLIKINCAAIPESLIESELFGHERGAFTGANERYIGKFEQASGGTVFLDEIGEIPLDIQSKLLRVLQEKEIERLGGKKTIKTDVRIIAATNRNLYQEVGKGSFRMDLYYRINVFPINLPPLRDRKEDIPLLVGHFLNKLGKENELGTKSLTPQILQKLINYSWPGNVRELQHVIERNMILNKGHLISQIDLPEENAVSTSLPTPMPTNESVEDGEKNYILEVIKSCAGKIAGKGGAAELLQIPVTTLRFKMKKMGISWQFSFGED